MSEKLTLLTDQVQRKDFQGNQFRLYSTSPKTGFSGKNSFINLDDLNIDPAKRITAFTATPASSSVITTTSDLRDSISTTDFLKYRQKRSAWAATTAYVLGDIIADENRQYICTTAGTSGATIPDFSLIYNTLKTDGTAQWKTIPRYDFAVAKSIADTSITIAGNALRTGSAYIEELYYIPFSKGIIIDYPLSSASFASAVVTDVAVDSENDLRKTPRALFVAAMAACYTNDTGAANSFAVIKDSSGNKLFTKNSSKGVEFVTGEAENWSDVTLDQTYTLKDYGTFRIDTDNAGNGDTAGALLTLYAIPLNLL